MFYIWTDEVRVLYKAGEMSSTQVVWFGYKTQFTENGLVLQARETIKSQSCPHTPAQVKQQTDGGHSNNRPLFLVLIMGKQDTKTSTLIYRLPNHCIQFPETEI